MDKESIVEAFKAYCAEEHCVAVSELSPSNWLRYADWGDIEDALVAWPGEKAKLLWDVKHGPLASNIRPRDLPFDLPPRTPVS